MDFFITTLLEGVRMSMDAFQKIRFVLWLILLANLSVAITKLVMGFLIRSHSLTADGIHSLTDSSSNIVGLIGIHLASKPIDEDHPYGHKKFETLAALFIAGMLLTLGSQLILTAINRLYHASIPKVTTVSLVALLITLTVNIIVSNVEYRQGKHLLSDILISDACHTRSDVYISLGVLFTLLGIKLGLPPWIDPIASLIVAGLIFHAAYEILSPTLGVLADKAVIDPHVIQAVAYSFDPVKNVHKIRSRGRTDDVQIDLHVMIDPAMSVEASHELTHAIEERLSSQLGGNIQSVIHVEPYYEPLSQIEN